MAKYVRNHTVTVTGTGWLCKLNHFHKSERAAMECETRNHNVIARELPAGLFRRGVALGLAEKRWTQEEIASVLGCDIEAVKTMIPMARKQLKTKPDHPDTDEIINGYEESKLWLKPRHVGLNLEIHKD